MTKGQEIKNSIAKDVVEFSKESINKLNLLIDRYSGVEESFDGIKLSKQYELLNQEGNVLLYGGRNSGKTFGCIQKIAHDASELGKDSVFVKSEASILKSKCFNVVKSYCLGCGIEADYSYNNMNREITFPNGAKIFFDFAEGYKFSKRRISCENIFFDSIEEVSEEDLKEILEKINYNKLIATIDNLCLPVSEKTLALFPNKYRLTIEDNEYATEMDYKLLNSYKYTDEVKYQAYRYGISEFWK